MTTAISRAPRTSQRFVRPPTSGLESDALLTRRPRQPDDWHQRIDDLLDIRRMENDWDGLGAPAPAPTLVDSALLLAQILHQEGVAPPCRIVAGLTGTVLFEWQYANGSYFELEVIRPQYAEWMQMLPGEPTLSAAITW